MEFTIIDYPKEREALKEMFKKAVDDPKFEGSVKVGKKALGTIKIVKHKARKARKPVGKK
jgi:hypothetical protein